MTNYGSIATMAETVGLYYEKVLLDNLHPELFFYKFGKKAQIPKHTGNTIRWTKYTNFTAQTTALTEGATPTEYSLSATNVCATLAQYGGHVIVTDLLPMVAIDNTMVNAAVALGHMAGESIDTIVREALTGTVQYANGVSGISGLATSDVFDSPEVRKAVRTLEAANVKKHSMTPGYYVGIIHPYQKYDLCGDTAVGGWIDVHKYTSSTPFAKNEVGRLYGVTFYETSQAYSVSVTGGVMRYDAYIFGNDAYGVAEIGVKNPQMITKAVGSAGADDPLNQRGTAAWKATFAAKLLDVTRLIVVKTGATA